MNASDPRKVALGIILAHFAVTLVHGISHVEAEVPLSLFGNLYVLAVILVAPLVAGILLYKVSFTSGGWLLTLSMAGALGFGLLYHFVLAGPDNVTQVHGVWHTSFLASAIAIAFLELAGVFWGVRVLQWASNRRSG